MTSYTSKQITALLNDLNAKTPHHSPKHSPSSWHLEQGKLTKHYTFKSFNEAFAFMTRCALYAEKIDHHPEWSNIYNQITVQLISHDTGDITDKDADLAKRMELYAGQRV